MRVDAPRSASTPLRASSTRTRGTTPASLHSLRSPIHLHILLSLLFFFFNDTATPEISPLSLHAPLPICREPSCGFPGLPPAGGVAPEAPAGPPRIARAPPRAAAPRRDPLRAGSEGRAPASSGPDRKSTRLNSSHSQISYAVFCLKKKTRV